MQRAIIHESSNVTRPFTTVGWASLIAHFIICYWPMVAHASQATAVIPAKEEHIRGQIARARDILETATFDFPSARLRNVKAGMSGDTMTFICGSINAKNRLGAYVGWQSFLIAGDELISEPQSLDEPGAARAAAAINTVCGTSGALATGGMRNGYTSPADWTSILSPEG